MHPCPLETCGCVASFNKATGYLTVYMTTQAPHLVRTVLAMLSGVAESKIRVVGGDIGGGFGNKVPVYPGYVVAIVASIVTGVPIKWIESRIDNISTTGFARDYHGVGELAADKNGRIKGLRFTRAGRPRRVQLARVGDQAAGGAVLDLHRLVRDSQRLLPRRRGLHQQGAGRRGVPLLAARDRSGVPDRTHDRTCWRRRSASTRPRSGAATSCRPSSFRTPRRSAGRSTAATTTARSTRC